MELESIERRKSQIQDIARQMQAKWAFRREDGSLLTSQEAKSDEVMRWEGSSIWNGQRWLRDESSSETLSYYVQTVRFRAWPNCRFDAKSHSSPSLRVENFSRINSPRPWVNVNDLEVRHIGPGFTLIEIYEFLDKYRTPCLCQMRGQRCCGNKLGAGWASSNGTESPQSPLCQNCQVSYFD